MKLVSYCFAFILLLTIIDVNGNAYPKKERTAHTYISQYENVLGTSMELKISTYSQADATVAENAVLGEIKRLSKILSAYDTQSEFSKWLKTSGQQVHVSNELFRVMQLFDEWRTRTNGALDASAEVVTTLWKEAALKQHIPTQKEIDNAVAEVKQTHWLLDTNAKTATHIDHAPLMLNSFVKSYIIKDAVDAALKTGDVKAVVLNIGGDMVIAGDLDENIFISDPKADAENEKPVDVLLINNKAVATSGNYRRGEMINGHWYSHIVDPRTGMPADNIISATVVAPNACDAGALATVFNVMPVSESIRLASTIPGIEYLIITKEGSRITSKGWSKLELPVNEKNTGKNNQPETSDKKNVWINDFEMIISLEINTQKESFSKRPYIAVWVEDTTHYPVRTISVWHGSDRYMPELKSWYLKYRNTYNSDINFKNSITSATRSAGKYTLKWDGKDDKGNYVKPGKYIVKIEVSREHGSYQLMRQEIVCDGTPKQINMTGNIEISSASLDYLKK
ncbi:MAG: DUF2271 domain-containing protein [Bacteroidetes bacterium]|nr:DUF2271 domain-containing protein [Bacteroidota bacterium]